MQDQSPFVWHELVAFDQTCSGYFFSHLFGWTRKEVAAGPFGIYTLFQTNGKDVAECAKRAPSLRGSVVVSPHDVPDVGRVRVVADPAGAQSHLIQPLKQ